MVTHRKYKYVNTTITDRVYQAVLIGNSSAPLTIFTLQWFWLANTRKRVLIYIFKKAVMRLRIRVLPVLFQ